MPRVIITSRRALALGLFVFSVVAFLYFLLPKVTGLKRTWDRLDTGAPEWLAAAAVFEGLWFAGYVALFRTVFVRAGARRSTGERATRSPWQGWRRRACSPRRAAAASR